jgi:hypothetical protein
MTLHERIRLAWAVLRGHQTWPNGYPTPWAYEQVCKALAHERATASTREQKP